MSDAGTDASLGDRLDAKLEEVKTAVTDAVNQLSAKVDQIQAALQDRLNQGQSAPPQPGV